MVAERGCAPGHGIAVGSRRGPWRITAGVEQLEKIQDKVGAKHQKICDGTSEPMNEKEIIKVVQRGPQEHVQNCTGEHAVDVPIRVIKMNLAKKYLEMLSEIAEKKDDYEKSYGQFGKCLKLGIHKSFIDGAEVAKLLRFNTSKSDDEQTKLKGDIARMKEGQHDIYYITGESIAVEYPALVWEYLRKKGHEVL